MKRIVQFLMILILCGNTFPIAYATAEITMDSHDLMHQIDSYTQEIGEEARNLIPHSANELLYDMRLDQHSLRSFMDMSPEDLIASIKNRIIQELQKPLKVLSSIVAVTILCALIEGVGSSIMNENLSSVFSSVAAVCIISFITLPIIECIQEAANTILDCSTFISALVPALTGVMIASGQAATATTYHMILFAACQYVSKTASTILVPLLGMYLAFCIVGSSVSSGLKVQTIAKSIKNGVTWALAFIMSIFVGMLTLQSFMGGAADTITTRAAKFMVSSFVPVIGSALSDAFAATRGCLGLIRSTLGGFGITICFLTFLPIVIKSCIWYLTLQVSAFVGDMLGTQQTSEVLRSCGLVLGMILSFVLCFALLMIISTTIVIMIGTGVTG